MKSCNSVLQFSEKDVEFWGLCTLHHTEDMKICWSHCADWSLGFCSFTLISASPSLSHFFTFNLKKVLVETAIIVSLNFQISKKWRFHDWAISPISKVKPRLDFTSNVHKNAWKVHCIWMLQYTEDVERDWIVSDVKAITKK